MVKLAGTLSRLQQVKVLVVGDIFLDSYTIGRARRISPEAPVVVVQAQREEHRPGGTGNVILNLVSMGCHVKAMGRVGCDAAGSLVLQSLQDQAVDTCGIVRETGYATPVKNRVIADNQQIVRIDHEKITPLPELLEQQVIDLLPQALNEVKVIAISDYGKGFLSRPLLEALILQGKLKGIPIIADPKGCDFTKYRGSTIIKPNLSEAFTASGLPPEAPLEHVAACVLEHSQSEALMLTRSEAGISLFHREGTRQDFPVRIREVKDVTGAGDTVLAMTACAIGNGLSLSEAAQLSNIAAGLAIERFGCARISLAELARRLLEHDVMNKIFDEEHLYALQKALFGRKFAILGLSGHQGMTSKIFTNLRLLSQNQEQDLLVFIKDAQPSEEFISLLASLQEVNFILLNSASLQRLCLLAAPDAVYEVNGNDFFKHETAAALFRTMT
jgi:D-glycero-beta-D-manno-heptose-7-phosphate kinase